MDGGTISPAFKHFSSANKRRMCKHTVLYAVRKFVDPELFILDPVLLAQQTEI
jgi:hypothetical protein